jgi:predicted RNase H-like HicB family nuclease
MKRKICAIVLKQKGVERMRYTVIVEREDGRYRVQIPSLPGLSAEGATQEEALKEAQHEAEAYLSRVALTTIEVNAPLTQLESAQAWLDAAGTFADDEEHLRHFTKLAAKRQHERDTAA